MKSMNLLYVIDISFYFESIEESKYTEEMLSIRDSLDTGRVSPVKYGEKAKKLLPIDLNTDYLTVCLGEDFSYGYVLTIEKEVRDYSDDPNLHQVLIKDIKNASTFLYDGLFFYFDE